MELSEGVGGAWRLLGVGMAAMRVGRLRRAMTRRVSERNMFVLKDVMRFQVLRSWYV